MRISIFELKTGMDNLPMVCAVTLDKHVEHNVEALDYVNEWIIEVGNMDSIFVVCIDGIEIAVIKDRKIVAKYK
jgi:hypothetical protein